MTDPWTAGKEQIRVKAYNKLSSSTEQVFQAVAELRKNNVPGHSTNITMYDSSFIFSYFMGSNI